MNRRHRTVRTLQENIAEREKLREINSRPSQRLFEVEVRNPNEQVVFTEGTLELPKRQVDPDKKTAKITVKKPILETVLLTEKVQGKQRGKKLPNQWQIKVLENTCHHSGSYKYNIELLPLEKAVA